MPPITMCMDNGLKPTVLNKYGIFNIFDFMTDQFVFQDTKYSSFSVWNTYVEASYLINRDIKFTFTTSASKTPQLTNLSVGKNYLEINADIFEIEMKESHTYIFGTCYQIKSNISIYPPNYAHINVAFNDSLDEIDFPQVTN